ncbi:MAG: lysylphosphatidylglycerol synthase domain-containing protein [Synergistetes bacterium]|nr:lysylphosphatidylglycerol synthase domain-containing protein [Synergistota bacterium]MDW8191617.1 lysylphosphatidylglycerol synthase domain-containing protein [Synergistota bacterium]
MRKKGLYIASGIGITAITLYFLLEEKTLIDALRLWRLSGIKGIIPAFVLYIITYLLRAERWRVLLPQKIKGRELFNIVAVHTAFANILPAKLGELAFPALLKRKGVGLIVSGSLLLLARGMDALCLLSLLILIIYPSLGAILISFQFGFTFWGFRTIERLFKAVLVVPKLKEVYSKGWERFGKEDLLRALGLTYFIWVAKGAGIACLLASSGRLNFFQAFKGSIGAECSFLIPLSGFLGLGNYELGWIIASGSKLEEAFFAHSFLILSSIIIAIICSLTSLKTSSTDIEDMHGRTP